MGRIQSCKCVGRGRPRRVFGTGKFESGIGAGLLIWDAADVIIRECAFHGATFGIKCGVGAKPSRNIHVENCLYENFPQYLWHRDWLSWEECYAGYSSSSLNTAVDDGTVVVNNLVVHAGDGLRITTNDVAIRDGLEISGNWLAFCTDDAIELDGHSKQINVHNNVVIECHEPFSASPILSGPVIIEYNLALNPTAGINGAQLKLMHPNSNPDRASWLPITNVDFRHNFAFGDYLCWSDGGPIDEVRVYDNFFCVSHLTGSPLAACGVDDQEECVVSMVTGTHVVTIAGMMERLRTAAAIDTKVGRAFRITTALFEQSTRPRMARLERSFRYTVDR